MGGGRRVKAEQRAYTHRCAAARKPTKKQTQMHQKRRRVCACATLLPSSFVLSVALVSLPPREQFFGGDMLVYAFLSASLRFVGIYQAPTLHSLSLSLSRRGGEETLARSAPLPTHASMCPCT